MFDFAQAGKAANLVNTIRSITSLEVGTAPKTQVFALDKLKLYHYAPTCKNSVHTPVLITYALVNRYYMMDLDEQRSLIRRLLAEGIQLYLIDWGYPDPSDRYLDLDDYINGYMHQCIEEVKQHAGVDKVNLLGVCQGGVFGACYTALHPKDIQNLITMVAPFDFQTEGNTLSNMARHIDTEAAHRALGNFSGELLNANFSMLNPVTLNVMKYIKATDTLHDKAKTEFFLRMEQWIQDSPDQAGAAMSEFVTKLYQHNQLMKGTFTIAGSIVDFKKITQPILNIYGTLDHIVPPAASKALKKLTASKDYQELSIETGHIGMYVSGRSGEIPPQLASWLQDRDQ